LSGKLRICGNEELPLSSTVLIAVACDSSATVSGVDIEGIVDENGGASIGTSEGGAATIGGGRGGGTGMEVEAEVRGMSAGISAGGRTDTELEKNYFI
jgi:hypothetical protein